MDIHPPIDETEETRGIYPAASWTNGIKVIFEIKLAPCETHDNVGVITKCYYSLDEEPAVQDTPSATRGAFRCNSLTSSHQGHAAVSTGCYCIEFLDDGWITEDMVTHESPERCLQQVERLTLAAALEAVPEEPRIASGHGSTAASPILESKPTSQRLVTVLKPLPS